MMSREEVGSHAHSEFDLPKPESMTAMSRETLRSRAEWLRRLREFFWERSFIEVETPVVSRDTVIDLHIDPIPLSLPGRSSRFYLQTSPEYLMKRLLTLGEPAIFQIAHAFRAEETGVQHNPEFTMCEWYRVGDDYQAGQELLAELAQVMFDVDGCNRLTYRNAFRQWAGVDPFNDSTSRIRGLCDEWLGKQVDGVARDVCLDLLFSEKVQPQLGQGIPTLLTDFPAEQSALAKVTARDYGWVAERYELFWKGLELANGYHELLDPKELAARQHQVNVKRVEAGKKPLPERSRLLDAMTTGLPPCSGVALGVERALQAFLDLESISEVMPFPIDQA